MQWDDAENLELPLVKVWDVVADGSDQQLVMARFRHCRFLTQQMGFLWLNLHSSCSQSGISHQLETVVEDAGPCITGDCFCQVIWWHLGKFWRVIFLTCLRPKHSVEERWIQQNICEIWDNDTKVISADQVPRADGWPILEWLGITGPLKSQDFTLCFFAYSPYCIAMSAVHLLLC